MISWGSTSTSPADGIERPLDRDVEALLLGARPVIGEIEALLDERIDVRKPALAGPRARVQQHVLDDRIGALAVLHHLAEVAGKQRHQFRRLLLIGRRRADRILQLIDELDRKRGEVVDEVQRVLDLVRDAGGQLAKRGELLGLDQPLLRGPELLERFRQFPGARFDVLEQARVLDGKRRIEPRRSGGGRSSSSETRPAPCGAPPERRRPARSQEWNDQERAIACAEDKVSDRRGRPRSCRSGTCTAWPLSAAAPM